MFDVEKFLTGSSIYFFVVIRNLVVVLIVFFLFSFTETKIEVVVLSVLLIIALKVFSIEDFVTLGFYGNHLAAVKLVRSVLIELKPESSYVAEWEKDIARSQEMHDGMETKSVINSVFYYFLWLVIIWKTVSIM